MNHEYGVYMYLDKYKQEIVYIGVDSHINYQQRHKHHINPNNYNQQQINRVLQNNLGRYKYLEYCKVETEEQMLQIEFDLINLYRPRFNFEHGGIRKHFKEDFKYNVSKRGMNKNGDKIIYRIYSRNHTDLVQSVDKKMLDLICGLLNNGEISEEDIKNKDYRKGRKMR